jgi:hypothetical protein
LWFPHKLAADNFCPNITHKIHRTRVMNLASHACSYCSIFFLYWRAVAC